MKKLIQCAVVVVVSMTGVDASASVFVDNFDMYGDYTEHLYSTTNAKVYYEYSWSPPTMYWAPISRYNWAEVVYKYDLAFSIESASVWAHLLALTWHDSTAQAYLDVSPNGSDWTQVDVGANGGAIDTTPIDVTNYLAGSNTAYIRARLSSRNRPIGAQFLRTTLSSAVQAPYVYEFRAEGADVVPEPHSILIWSVLALAFGGVAWRRKRNKA